VAALPLRGQDAGKELKLAKEVTNSIGMKLVLVPPGKFIMGSPKDEKDREPIGEGQEEEHEVEITQPFYMGIFEVTQAQYEKVMGKNPSFFSATGAGKKDVKDVANMDTRNFPVEQVSWNDAIEFCKRLSALPKEKETLRVYGLPTEAEWEYACRGGPVSSRAPFHFKKPSDSLSFGQANFDSETPYGGGTKGKRLGRTCAVGSYEPNRLGLYDMHGNVMEWCADAYNHYYAKGPKRDPKGIATGPNAQRVLRGGFWFGNGVGCRAANRGLSVPNLPSNYVGFRVVVHPGAKTP
jgi:formylglycine-generating enzyme required for sulfatase activity